MIFGGFKNDTTDGHKVPNIVGMTVEEAERLEDIKGIFKIEVIGTREDSKFSEGQIISQDPVEGTVRKNNLTIQDFIVNGQFGEHRIQYL